LNEPEIVFAEKGALGTVLLNRPKALNALTVSMVESFTQQLRAWAEDDRIKAVSVRGAGGKAFCAGGDIIRLYEDGKAGGPYPRQFYWNEYRNDTLIKRYPKPYVAIMDGIVMGGGVGVSVHASHRIATERTMFAMPETGIGLFPDVGGTYFLPRLPSGLGLYLGLTGRRLTGADCIAIGLADVFIPRERIDAFEAALAGGDVDGTIKSFATDFAAAPISAELAQIERYFGSDTVEGVLQALEADTSDWAKATAASIRQKSPMSLKVAARQMKEGINLSFEDCMRLEWRVANRFIDGHDFYEGVRALLVDKDMTPRWRPAALAEVSDAEVERYFAPLPGKELDLSDIPGAH
jgi:enoyl-CoA hydratase